VAAGVCVCAADASVCACAIAVGVFMDTAVGNLGDVAGVGNAAAGIRGRTAAVNISADVCGPCALALG